MQTNWYTSSRSIDYYRTTHEWLMANSLREKIDNPEHKVEKFEIDLGIYLKF